MYEPYDKSEWYDMRFIVYSFVSLILGIVFSYRVKEISPILLGIIFFFLMPQLNYHAGDIIYPPSNFAPLDQFDYEQYQHHIPWYMVDEMQRTGFILSSMLMLFFIYSYYFGLEKMKLLKLDEQKQMEREKLIEREYKMSLNKPHIMTEEEAYLFRWDKIPGNDVGRLREFLKQHYDIDWVKTANIEKMDDNKTIKVSFKDKFLSLILNDKNTTVNLKMYDGRTYEFDAKIKNGKLNTYQQLL